MGCCISKRQAPANQGMNNPNPDTRCDCQRRKEENIFDKRFTIFRSLEYYFSHPPGPQRQWTQDLVYTFFVQVFDTNNYACNLTCSDQWIRPGSLTGPEKQMINIYFLDFAEMFTSYPEFNLEIYARFVLSGIVLFRMELLPIFLNEIDADDPRIRPFIMRMVHWEMFIRQMLSGNDNVKYIQTLIFMQVGRLSEHLKEAHEWWREGYTHSGEIDFSDEYSLTD